MEQTNEQRSSIKLTRTSTGKVGWEIKVYAEKVKLGEFEGEDINTLPTIIERLDKIMKEKFGDKNGS